MLPWQHFMCLATFVVVPTASVSNCTTFTTFGASLGLDVQDADSRLPLIVDALKNSAADVLCLQDLWFEKDIDYILQELRFVYRHHYSEIHLQPDTLRHPTSCIDQLYEPSRTKDISCTYEEAATIKAESEACGLNFGCDLLTGVERDTCIATNCPYIFNRDDISQECVSCLHQNYGLPPGGALKECTWPKYVDNRVNGPGLLVLSKKELQSATYTSFFPNNKMAYEKGYIDAKLYDGKEFACTQLTGLYVQYTEFNLTFSSHKEMNEDEVLTLIYKFGNEDHILLGDLNIGPEVIGSLVDEMNLVGEAPENYDLLIQAGFTSPYMEQNGHCTLCEDNPLIPKSPNKNWYNNVLDHLLIKSNSRYSAHFAMRVLDTDTPPLSDHYGVEVQVCEK